MSPHNTKTICQLNALKIENNINCDIRVMYFYASLYVDNFNIEFIGHV